MRQFFRDRVRAIVAKIPKGKTMTYKEVATKAGNPKAARAVGAIMRSNYNRDIPCHRVIRSDGSFGSYNRGGPLRKKAMLKSEGVLQESLTCRYDVWRFFRLKPLSKTNEYLIAHDKKPINWL